MKRFMTYTGYRGACKVRAYFSANNIQFDEWHDPDGYEFEAMVTPEQYNELRALIYKTIL